MKRRQWRWSWGKQKTFVIPAKAGTQEAASLRRDLLSTVYLLASRRNGTLYVGVTSDLLKRVVEHREGLMAGFTQEYGVKLLVWFEQHATMEFAIQREKRIKKWNRAWKLQLIEAGNSDWRDLAEDFGLPPISQSGFPLSRE